MREFKRWLAALLGLQLCLVAALYIADRDTADFDQQQRLVMLEKEAIQGLHIADGDATVKLVRQDEVWRLPEYGNLPVDEGKLAETLDKLLDSERGWPVASTLASQRRFEVSEDEYQRKIVLALANDDALTLYLGTSPSYRDVHARIDGEDEVFSVELATFDFPVTDADWFDKKILSVDEPSSIKGPDFELSRNDDEWTFVEAAVVDAQATAIDTEKAQKLSNLFKNMRVQSLAENIDPAEETRDLTVSQDDDATWTYQFFAQEDAHYVKRQDLDAVFVISKNDFDKAAQVNRDYLAAKPEASEEHEEGSASLDLSVTDGN